MIRVSRFVLVFCAAWIASLAGHLSAEPVVFSARDADTGAILPCRWHLADEHQKAFRPDPLVFFRDHFVTQGRVRIEMPPDKYVLEVERGPEYSRWKGSFEVQEGETTTVDVELNRLVDLSAEGWWSGDLHVHRSLSEIEVLMRAENLHVAPVITWWNNQNHWAGYAPPEQPVVQFDGRRFYDRLGGEDEREGGALLFFGLPKPLPLRGSSREYPTSVHFLRMARQTPGAWIDIEKPFWWDVPVWLATGQVDSIGLANNHMCRASMYESEAWGKPRDTDALPPPRGNGFWTQEIYYHILNAGLRIPPSAGSASGVLPNPVGYNRVYVHVGENLEYDAWWEGLRQGRVFVTNGPLLRVTASGALPGNVFTLKPGESQEVELVADLTTEDPVSAIELVQNGQVVRRVPWETSDTHGSLGTLKLEEGGWFLARIIADVADTFRFASTGPFYVDVEGQSRQVSRASAQFFLDWVRERRGRVELEDPEQQREAQAMFDEAEAFWSQRVAEANAK